MSYEGEMGVGTIDNPWYPEIEVELTGIDGNTGSIMAAVSRGLKRNGVSYDQVEKMREEMLSGDYNNVIQTAMRWVCVS